MYVIAGATGHTGSVIARTLRAQGKPVRALTRHPDKAADLRSAGAEILAVDLDDADALARALANATGAYLLLPPRPTSNQVLADQARVVENIGRAVERSRVPHVVFLSSIGAHLAAGTGPIRSLHQGEERLRKSGAAVTSIRAAYFMENWLPALGAVGGGVLPTFIRADLPVPMVATPDIGRVAAGALLEGGRGFQVIELVGPRDYSAADVAAAASAIVGKPVRLQINPEEAVVPTFMSFGMSEDVAALYREMVHGFNDGTIKLEGGAARKVRGITPIEDVLRPALASG